MCIYIKMNWVVYPIICAIMWGIGYTLVKPVSDQLQPYTINALYGAFVFIINIIALAIKQNFDNFKLINNWKLGICLMFYIILLATTSIIFLIGYKLDGVNSGVYTLISSTYPVITLILSYIFLGQTNINPYYASFGTVLTLVGVSLLALSKK